MITVTVTPRNGESVYQLLSKKEPSLKTFFRRGKKKPGEVKWVHSTYNGWIRLQRCLGGIAVATVQSKKQETEWQILSAFIGVLGRHFKNEVSSINLSLGVDDE